MRKLHDLTSLRDDILDILKRSPAPVQLVDLSKRLRIRSESEEYDYLRNLLTKMAEEGLVQRHSRRRYSLLRGQQGVPSATTCRCIARQTFLAP